MLPMRVSGQMWPRVAADSEVPAPQQSGAWSCLVLRLVKSLVLRLVKSLVMRLVHCLVR